MRPPQNNKRMRGRSNNNSNRRGPNPLTRSYESNGPDVKVRGTAAHIAEKYVQLARDAHVSGDPVAAESYLQHAEHYFRLIAAAQLAQNPPPRSLENGVSHDASGDDGDDEDFDGGVSDRFTYRAPQSYQAPVAGQAFPAGESAPTEAGGDQPEQPVYGDRQDARQDGRQDNRQDSRQDPRQDPRNANRFDNRNRFEPRRDNRTGQPRGNEFPRNDNRSDGNRFDPQQRRERTQRPDRADQRFDQPRSDQPRSDPSRSDQQRFDPARADQPRIDAPRNDSSRSEPARAEGRGERSFEPRPQRSYPAEIADVQPILPSFITAPVRAVGGSDESEDRVVPLTPATAEDAPAPRPRRRRKVVAAHDDVREDGDAPVSAVDTPAAE